jgi:hypothetical protein
VRIRLPGHYEDGDGGPHSGVTSSDVERFQVGGGSSSAPAGPAGIALTSWGRIKKTFR